MEIWGFYFLLLFIIFKGTELSGYKRMHLARADIPNLQSFLPLPTSLYDEQNTHTVASSEHQLQPPTRIHRYHWRNEQSTQSGSENKRDNKSPSLSLQPERI